MTHTDKTTDLLKRIKETQDKFNTLSSQLNELEAKGQDKGKTYDDLVYKQNKVYDKISELGLAYLKASGIKEGDILLLSTEWDGDDKDKLGFIYKVKNVSRYSDRIECVSLCGTHKIKDHAFWFIQSQEETIQDLQDLSDLGF